MHRICSSWRTKDQIVRIIALKIETQTLEDHQVKLIVEPGAEALESAKQRAARRLSKRAKIPGFRPGKAPYPVIVRHFGESAILEEALELLVDEVYPKAIEEAGISPYGPGSLENVESLEPVSYTHLTLPTKRIV